MPYVPGDNWVICDLSGKKVLMSQTRKTWDGLRVWYPLWYPKHPQLTLKPILDRMAVIDGRPRSPDRYITMQFGLGAFCLESTPPGVYWTFWADDDGALIGTNTKWGTPIPVFYIDHYAFTVAPDGALHVTDVGVKMGVLPWKMTSPDLTIFDVTVGPDLAVHLTPEA